MIFVEGFCRRIFGINIIAFTAISFKGVILGTISFINFVISSVYCFPAFPDGNRISSFSSILSVRIQLTYSPQIRGRDNCPGVGFL